MRTVYGTVSSRLSSSAIGSRIARARQPRFLKMVAPMCLIAFLAPVLNPSAHAQSESHQQAIRQLIEQNQALLTEIELLKQELAVLKLEVSKIEKQRDDLQQFIDDHETYGTAFEQYTYFRELMAREARERHLEEVKARREEQRKALRERRQQSLAQRQAEQDKVDSIRERHDKLRRAGFSQVDGDVYVGQMGYAFKTTKEKTIRYSPLYETYYLDEDETIDYSEMTLSGSLVQAGEQDYDIGVAIAFFDEQDSQIGQTVVRVNGARPGVPYPFTSTVPMAANRPFKTYTAWVLYYDPIPLPEPAAAVPDSTDNAKDSDTVKPDDEAGAEEKESGGG